MTANLNNTVNENRGEDSFSVDLFKRHGQECGPGYAENHNKEDGKSAGDIPQESVHVTEDRVGEEKRLPIGQGGCSNWEHHAAC